MQKSKKTEKKVISFVRSSWKSQKFISEIVFFLTYVYKLYSVSQCSHKILGSMESRRAARSVQNASVMREGVTWLSHHQLWDVAHQPQSLTHLIHTAFASWCPRTPTMMGFYFPSVRLKGLPVQGGMMANFCIWALLHLSRNILRISDFLESFLSCSTFGSTGQWC